MNADVEIRPYDRSDADALWTLKRGFELGLGSGTGSDAKREQYANKLTETYRREYLSWVDRCTEENPRSVTVAVSEEVATISEGTEATTESREEEPTEPIETGLVGYVFVLPASLCYIWDAAVLNELYVVPEFRGGGVADELMEEAIAIARDQPLPLDRIVLDVDRENDRARAFYDRYGFEHWGEMVAREL